MYWWSIEKLAQNLARNRYVRSDTILFWLLNILLTICQSVVYTGLIFSFLLIEYHFKDWLPNQHAQIETYNTMSWILSSVNTVLMVLGIAWCYYKHKRNKGIHFWQRFSALNSSIGFHVLLYSTAILFITVSVIYVLVHIRIETFKCTIFPTESPTDFFGRLFNSPFGVKALKAAPASRGFFANLASLPCTIASLPFIPGKIAAFLQELRIYVMQFYPIFAFIPTLLLTIQYYLVQRWFDVIGHPAYASTNTLRTPTAKKTTTRKKASVRKTSVSAKSTAGKKTTPPSPRKPKK